MTSIPVTAPTTGVFYVKVVALPGGETSNEVQVVVASLVPPPAAPGRPAGVPQRHRRADLLAARRRRPAAGYILRVGTSPGGSDLGVIPTGATGLAVGGGVPAGIYYLAVSAVNAGGQSAEATTVLNMPAGGACDAPPAPALTTAAWGSFLTANWSPVPGAVSYLLSAAGPGHQHQRALRRRHDQLPLPQSAARDVELRHPGAVLLRRLRRRRRARCSPSTGPRCGCSRGHRIRPTTPTSSYAPGIIHGVAAAYPGDLANSCLEHGGNNRWLFRVVRALRERDKRWGLNWKRANVGDMSQDVITYNWGTDPDEGTFKLRAWDIIGGHCGSRPGAQFSEITSPKPPNYSSGARWTLMPYIQAGNAP